MDEKDKLILKEAITESYDQGVIDTLEMIAETLWETIKRVREELVQNSSIQ